MKQYAILVALVACGLGVLGAVPAAASPMADAGLDQSVTVETTVQLDGTGSAHPDGEIADYEWTIQTPGGAVITPECATCERTTFTPEETGRYEVTLAVTDASGEAAIDTLFVYVDDAGPSVVLDGETTPDVGETVEYTAEAVSSDAELEEIAWAVEDEIIAVQSLDSRSDVAELSTVFAEADTYRVQVVVQDANGRTAYDQLYVQPVGDEPAAAPVSPPVEPSEPPPEGPEPDLEILVGEIPGVSYSVPTEQMGQPESLYYVTEGYDHILEAGAMVRDSAYMGMAVEAVGLDGGENAPWEQSMFDMVIREPLDATSTLLFGQEEETVTCEWVVGEISSCAGHVMELEMEGRTTNVYSPDKSGAYSEYGLRGGERVRGEDPTQFELGQEVEATVVIQPEKEGVINVASRTVRGTASSSAQGISDFVGSVVGNHEDGLNSAEQTSTTEQARFASAKSTSRTETTRNFSGSPNLSSSSSTSFDRGHATVESRTYREEDGSRTGGRPTGMGVI